MLPRVDRISGEPDCWGVEALNEQMADPSFWDHQDKARQTVDKLKILKNVYEPWKKAEQDTNDTLELLSMVDENQPDSFQDIKQEVDRLSKEVAAVEFQRQHHLRLGQ